MLRSGKYAIHSEAMQRGVATALAILFSWLLLVPVFATPALVNVPACCRKSGSHQCTMHSSGTSGSERSIQTVQAKCPYAYGSSTRASHVDSYAPGIGESVYAGVIRHPAISPQTDARFRVSYDRSQQKRGPPAPILS